MQIRACAAAQTGRYIPCVHRAILSALLMITLTSGTAVAAEPNDAASAELCVMTYNLRFASARPPNAWPDRRPLMRECIRSIMPDLMGTQEGVYGQLKDLAADLPEYDWIGLGREGGSRGEFMAIFYRRDRFEPLAYDHFWLSDTPDVIASSTWGNSVRRMVTWVRFLDRRTKQEFYHWNTHFDHQVQAAREKSAVLLRQRIEALKTELPVIVTGDFNAAAGRNAAYDELVGPGRLTDTWLVADRRSGEGINTFNGFEPLKREGVRIDWILTRGPVVTLRAAVETFGRDGQYPSDHFPVVAWLRTGE